MKKVVVIVALLLIGVWISAEKTEANTNPFAPKSDGYHRVGIDIAPGLWRSNGSNDDCFWERLNSRDEAYDSHFGYAGGSVRIRENDDRVRFVNCATWTYVENTPKQLQPTAYDNKTDGFYVVGVDIAPGNWQAIDSFSDCYHARRSDDQSVIDERWGDGTGFISVAATDYEIELDKCGEWVYLGGHATNTPTSQSDDCTIPASGPWPPCATGSNGGTASDCVIPESGPWPPCATGGSSVADVNSCVIPPSGPWPACAR